MAVEMSHNVAPCVQWEKSASAVFLLVASQDSGLTPYTFNSLVLCFIESQFFLNYFCYKQEFPGEKSQKLRHNISLKQII